MIRASAPYTLGWGSFCTVKNGLCQGNMGRQFEHVTLGIVLTAFIYTFKIIWITWNISWGFNDTSFNSLS